MYSHLKRRFWVYQNPEALSAWTVSRRISIKKKRAVKLDPGTYGSTVGLRLCHFISLGYYCWEILPHWKKLGHWTILFGDESDTVVFSKLWHHPYFHHIMVWVPVIAYSLIWKDFVSRYGTEHIYLWCVSGVLCFCVRIFQVSSLTATCDK